MKFRNIITLLFTVSVFSSAYSMNDLGVSPLSQEVDPDTGAIINHIYTKNIGGDFQRSRSMSSFTDLRENLDLQRFTALNLRKNLTKRNSDKVKRRYEMSKFNIIEFHVFAENALKAFVRNKERFSEEKFEEFIGKGYDELFKATFYIGKLRSSIINNFPQKLSSRLIISLDSVELEINNAMNVYLDID